MIYTIDEIRDTLRPILDQTPVKRAILFGSYAKGCPREESDIDLMIDSEGALMGLSFYGVYDMIANAFAVPVELLEKIEIIPGGPVDREIDRTGVKIYAV